MSRNIVTKERILAEACALADERGLSALGIREVAAACGVSVGSVYTCYASKAELVADVVGAFWARALSKDEMHARMDEGFIAFCRRLSAALASAADDFRDGTLGSARSLDAKSLAVARKREEECFSHIERGLAAVLMRDARVNRSMLAGALEPKRLCSLAWSVMLESCRKGDASAETLFSLLEAVLYRDMKSGR